MDTQVAHTVATLIEMNGISKSFGENQLFDKATLSVYPGETLAIIGESGCGKSVFLKMMIGLIDVDEGTVMYKGKDLATMDMEGLNQVHREMAYVFQGDALFDSMTILDNVGYGLREHTKQGDDEIRARVIECLHMVGLEERILDQHPASLSGGMRKRVALARAVAIKPEVILYDEPTGGLDPQNITRIGEMIQLLQGELNATSVLVSHDMRTAFSVSQRIAMIHERKFWLIGTPDEFRNSTDPIVNEYIEEALAEEYL